MNENYFELEIVINDRKVLAVGRDLGEEFDFLFKRLNSVSHTARKKLDSLISAKNIIEEQKWLIDILHDEGITELDEDTYNLMKVNYPEEKTRPFSKAMDNLSPIVYLTSFGNINEHVPNNKVRMTINTTTKEITFNMHNYFYLVACLSFAGTDKDLIRGEIETEPYQTSDFFDEIDFKKITLKEIRSFAKAYELGMDHTIVLKERNGYYILC